MCCRIGEAANPGPTQSNFVLGVFNPSGLKGKAPTLFHICLLVTFGRFQKHTCVTNLLPSSALVRILPRALFGTVLVVIRCLPNRIVCIIMPGEESLCCQNTLRDLYLQNCRGSFFSHLGLSLRPPLFMTCGSQVELCMESRIAALTLTRRRTMRHCCTMSPTMFAICPGALAMWPGIGTLLQTLSLFLHN